MASRDKKTPERESAGSEMLRRFKQNPLVSIGTLVILIIVVIAFVLVPAIVPESGRGRNADLTFGYYDKIPITYVPGNFFARYLRAEEERYRQYNIDINSIELMRYLWRGSFEEAAVHTAILQEMKKAGYEAPEKVVDREIAKFPQFQENGRFSPALYRQWDENERLSQWRQVQEDIAKNHFRSDVTGLRMSDAEAGFIGRMAATERTFEMVVFPVDAFPEDEYVTYLEGNPDLFRTVHLSMITVSSSEREARKILASIRDGETTFEDAARAHSTVYADRGGDMGIRVAHELQTDIPEEDAREAVIALARGGYSDVIKTLQGWSFFRAEEDLQNADASDPAVLESVRSYMRNFNSGRMEDWAIGQANDFRALVDEIGFEDALLQQGKESSSFGPVPINYGSVDLFAALSSPSFDWLSNSATDEKFWNVAFSTPINTLSEPMVQRGNVFVLLPTAETEAEESSIEGIVSTYKSYWINYMTEQSLRQSIINSPRLDNKFNDTFNSLFIGG